jgi:hypothetical protein
MLQAQTKLYSQTPTPCNDVEAYKVYESLLPADWTVTVAHARRLLSQAQTGGSAQGYIVLSPVAFNMNAVIHAAHSRGGEATSYDLESKHGIWNSMRWRITSRAWAS